MTNDQSRLSARSRTGTAGWRVRWPLRAPAPRRAGWVHCRD